MGSPPVPTRPTRRRPRLARWLTALAVLALAPAAVWWALRPPSPQPLEPGWPAAVSVLAGDGVAGTRDGDAPFARFSDPFGVAVAADGTIYVADAGETHRIRRISPSGRVSTWAGGERGFADGAGQEARFDTPSALALDTFGNLFVADTGNNAVRRITANGQVSTWAGTGVAGYRDGPAHEAQFNGPVGIAVDDAGRVVVADTYNDRIRIVEADGTVWTLAGSGRPGAADGAAGEARFDTPSGVAVDASGTMYVADTGNSLVRTVNPAGFVTTTSWIGDAPFQPIGIAASPSGDVYVTDERGRIVEIAADGLTRTLAGSAPGFRDGAGGDARFRSPAGLALAAPGRLVVADAGNALIRLVSARARLAFGPPPSPRINPHFNADRFASLPLLWPVAPFDGPHEVAGTLGEARGEAGADRLHAGIDIRAEQGTLVHAVRDGVVTSPVATGGFNSLNEWVRIGPLAYVHLRAGRGRRHELFDLERFVPAFEGGALVGMRVKRGARFATGEVIGSVNPFNHVHLNVGWPGEEFNPLDFRLVQFEDRLPPTIAPGGVRLYDEGWQPLTRRAGRRRIEVSGRVRIVVDAWDQADGNRADRRLGLHELGYQVLDADLSPASGFETPRRTLVFDRLAPGPEAPALVYASGSGIPFYRGGRTRFLYVVTNTLHDGVASQGFWDTTLLAPGDYVVRAWVVDVRGNVAIGNRDVPVTVVSPPGARPDAPPD